jgi:hypothetical protein
MFTLYAINEGTPLSRDSEGQQHPVADDANVNPRFPSPEVLAQVIDRTQQLLGGSAASSLSVCHLSLLVMFCIFSFAILINPEILCLGVDGGTLSGFVVFCIFPPSDYGFLFVLFLSPVD